MLPDIEVVSAAVHAAWMDSKRAQGVTTRKAEDGEELMAPYEQLSEKAKQLDRGTVQAVYAAINASASESWRPMETAPKDGTLVLLLIYQDEERCCPLEDTAKGSRTVGHNNFAHDGEDRWLFAGWSWEQDHYTQGDGNPAGWLPVPEAQK